MYRARWMLVAAVSGASTLLFMQGPRNQIAELPVLSTPVGERPAAVSPVEAITEGSRELGEESRPAVAVEPFSPSDLTDPSRPATWANSPMEPVNIGPSIDPADPSTWPQRSPSLSVDIGEPIDPSNPAEWAVRDVEPVDIGAPSDPSMPASWPVVSREDVEIGEPVDPDRPSPR